MAAALAIIVHWSVGVVVFFQSSACDGSLLNGHRSKSEYGSRQLVAFREYHWVYEPQCLS